MLVAHPYANLFPMISGADFEGFSKNIKDHGVQQPIVVFDGKILDGRNRYAAAQQAGIDCPQIEYTGTDPLGFVIASNLHRRHLTTAQRAAIAAELANMAVGSNPGKGHVVVEGGSFDPPSDQPAMTIEQAASALNVGTASVKRAKATMKADPAAHEAAKAGVKPKEKETKKESEVKNDPDTYPGYYAVFHEAGIFKPGSGSGITGPAMKKFRESFGADYPTGQKRDPETDKRIAIALAHAMPVAKKKAAAEEVKTLPETSRKKLERLEAALRARIEEEFDDRLQKAIREQLPAAIARFEKLEKDAAEEYKKYHMMRSGIKPQLTEEDYRFLRQTIAPDRFPEEYRAKMTRAAQIINSFNDYVGCFKSFSGKFAA